MIQIAVLLATFNRKEKTLSCLKTLYDQQVEPGVKFNVFLTDDASSDGTVEAVKAVYPEVNIFRGSGQLFWAGGMRNTWTEALKSNPDYYLLLNDDTELEPFAVQALLNYKAPVANVKPAIMIGSTKDHFSEAISYGGHRLYNKGKVQYYSTYSPTEYMACDLANANIMLVPAEVVKEIGILSDRFTHSIADFDYTIRANKHGFPVMVAPGILGYCTDDHGNNWKSSGNSTLKDRIKYLKSPKGLAYHEYLYFIRQHFPGHLPVAMFKLWAKTLFPVLWDKFKVRGQ